MKIFQIDFNRCGTRTLHRYLRGNGVRSVHWDKGRLARRIFCNLANGDPLLTGYQDFQAFSDMEFSDRAGLCCLEAYKLFPYLAAQYPDGVFILNTRDRETWLRSRLHHGGGEYAARQRAHHNVRSEEELVKIWSADWDAHHRRVLEFFKDSPYRFFVWRLETCELPRLFDKQFPELNPHSPDEPLSCCRLLPIQI
jgi:hypothetical protein